MWRGFQPAFSLRHKNQMSAVQNLHFVASGAIASLHRGQFFEGAGGASLISDFVIRYTTKAMIRKSTTVPKNVPYLSAFTASLPSGPTVLLNTSFAERHSPLGSTRLINGMIKSAASDDTTLPTAPPTITAIANASTLFFSRNSLKPLIMRSPPRVSGAQEFRQPLHCGFEYRSLRRVTNAERTFATFAERHTGREPHARLFEQSP